MSLKIWCYSNGSVYQTSLKLSDETVPSTFRQEKNVADKIKKIRKAKVSQDFKFSILSQQPMTVTQKPANSQYVAIFILHHAGKEEPPTQIYTHTHCDNTQFRH